MGNYAYIDNQNLYMATNCADKPWNVDMYRLRVYLKEKYHVSRAYLFMGAYSDKRQHMYEMFQSYGYVLVWRPHSENMKGNKKGNVDTDVVFYMMRDAYEDLNFEKAILVSGDGDYYNTVEHLIKKGRFGKLILPSFKNASSLYKLIDALYVAWLDDIKLKIKMERHKKGAST